MIIATTSERAVVAYSDAGVRLWQLDLDELAPSAPVRLNGTDAVLVDLSGRVQAFSILTGAVRWDRSVGSDVKLSPAVGAGLVVIMDRGGTTTALDQATGRSAWTVDLEGKGAAFVGGTPGRAAGPDGARAGPGHRSQPLAATVPRHVHPAGDAR